MKKVLSLILVAVLCLSLVACGGNTPDDSKPKNDPEVVAYVEEYGDVMLESMESSFATSSGMTCKSTIEAVGSGIVISININELEDVPQETKDAMQSAYDQMSSTFEGLLQQLQQEVPEVTYLKISVCEKDGDVLAVIKAGK